MKQLNSDIVSTIWLQKLIHQEKVYLQFGEKFINKHDLQSSIEGNEIRKK